MTVEDLVAEVLEAHKPGNGKMADCHCGWTCTGTGPKGIREQQRAHAAAAVVERLGIEHHSTRTQWDGKNVDSVHFLNLYRCRGLEAS